MDEGTFLYFIFAAGLNNSVILRNNQTFLAWLDKWLKPVMIEACRWLGFLSTFHSKCDGKGPSVTIIRVGKYIFGGYASQLWGPKNSGK